MAIPLGGVMQGDKLDQPSFLPRCTVGLGQPASCSGEGAVADLLFTRRLREAAGGYRASLQGVAETGPGPFEFSRRTTAYRFLKRQRSSDRLLDVLARLRRAQPGHKIGR